MIEKLALWLISLLLPFTTYHLSRNPGPRKKKEESHE
jgi:hypothetical protein